MFYMAELYEAPGVLARASRQSDPGELGGTTLLHSSYNFNDNNDRNPSEMPMTRFYCRAMGKEYEKYTTDTNHTNP